MKAGTQNHVKTKRLMRILGIPLYRAVGVLETLWLLCTDCCDEGNIGKFTDEEIADYLGWDGKQTPTQLMEALVESGWLDRLDGPHRLAIHDWREHAPDFLKDRWQKREWRAKKRSILTTYDDFPPDNAGQPPDMDRTVRSFPNPTQPNQFQPGPTNTNTNSASAEGGSVKQAYSANFERWYSTYPRKTQKQAASAAFGRALKRICDSGRHPSSADALDWLCDVTRTFADSSLGRSEYAPYPATWLNQGRYDDDQAEWNRKEKANGNQPGPGQRCRN